MLLFRPQAAPVLGSMFIVVVHEASQEKRVRKFASLQEAERYADDVAWEAVTDSGSYATAEIFLPSGEFHRRGRMPPTEE